MTKSVLALLVTLCSAAAFADSYTASPMGPQETACPASIAGLEVQTKAKSTSIESASLVLSSGAKLSAKLAYSSTECMSDIVCYGDDIIQMPVAKGVLPGGITEVVVMARHANNHEYPTTDYAQVDSMELLMFKGTDDVGSCFYNLTPQ